MFEVGLIFHNHKYIMFLLHAKLKKNICIMCITTYYCEEDMITFLLIPLPHLWIIGIWHPKCLRHHSMPNQGGHRGAEVTCSPQPNRVASSILLWDMCHHIIHLSCPSGCWASINCILKTKGPKPVHSFFRIFSKSLQSL